MDHVPGQRNWVGCQCWRDSARAYSGPAPETLHNTSKMLLEYGRKMRAEDLVFQI